jgi:LysR family hydrogen peroxide-inducible transcriptional activator
MRNVTFGKAAEACGISQPALSVQIRELERELGAVLFERGARQARLTGFGEEFAGRVRDILRAVDELGDIARASGNTLSGRLRVGVIPTVAPYLLPTIISGLSQSHPALELHVRETVTPKLIGELEEGRLDTAIVGLPVSEPALAEVPLFDENFLLVRPAEDEGKPVPDRDTLREMRLLLLEEGHCFRDQALSFCNLNSVAPRELLDGSSLSTLVQMVGAGIGVTLIPEMAVPVETRSAFVSLARFAEPQPARTIGMVWRRTSPLANQLTQVSQAVSRFAAEWRCDNAVHI